MNHSSQLSRVGEAVHAPEVSCARAAGSAESDSVETALFLRELPEGRVRLSLRSKGVVNVAAIAARLGDGGHETAAGCTLDGPLSRAREEILAELRRAMAGLAAAPA